VQVVRPSAGLCRPQGLGPRRALRNSTSRCALGTQTVLALFPPRTQALNVA